ncbi:hypothetical protein [Corynebacterium sp. A21]|uniref:hypothetical protein n=1 Tax=Corynebacterium sp. A21 TaxID=3457318 RepID=UPI003FD69EA1
MKDAFPSRAKEWQRIDVNGAPIDLVLFGEVENPPGEVSGDDSHVLNVAGFREVFGKAEDLPLTDEISVKLPSVPGFAGLKLHAWFDRWPAGKYKDASDLALILSWYEDDNDKLWDRYLALDNEEEYLGDTDGMAATLLGFDIGDVLGIHETPALLKRFESEPDIGLDRFAEWLLAPPEHEHPLDRRSLQVEALMHGLKLSPR